MKEAFNLEEPVTSVESNDNSSSFCFIDIAEEVVFFASAYPRGCSNNEKARSLLIVFSLYISNLHSDLFLVHRQYIYVSKTVIIITPQYFVILHKYENILKNIYGINITHT